MEYINVIKQSRIIQNEIRTMKAKHDLARQQIDVLKSVMQECEENVKDLVDKEVAIFDEWNQHQMKNRLGEYSPEFEEMERRQAEFNEQLKLIT